MMSSYNSNNIPEKVINEIAGLIDCGLICFLNPETLEIETIMGNSYYDDYSDMRDEIFSRIDNWPKCIEIVPPESWEGFKIMENLHFLFRKHQLYDKDFLMLWIEKNRSAILRRL